MNDNPAPRRHALPAGLGAGGRASRRRPPGLAPGRTGRGQPADEPRGRLGQLGVAHVELASQARDEDQPDLARDHLTAALDLACDLGYL
jgi:hypothetical protein